MRKSTCDKSGLSALIGHSKVFVFQWRTSLKNKVQGLSQLFLNISLSPANPCLWLIRVYWHHPFHVNTTSFVWLLSLIATVRLTKVRQQKAVLSISNSLHNTSPGVTKAKQQTKKVLFLKRRKMKSFLTRGLRSDCWGWISIIVDCCCDLVLLK